MDELKDKCFPEHDTRVLTNHGFLFLSELEERLAARETVLYACYDESDTSIVYAPGKLVYVEPPTQWVDFTHAGTRRLWDSSSDDHGRSTVPTDGGYANRLTLRTTPEHDMYVQLCTGYERRKAGGAAVPPHKMTAQELAPGYQCDCVGAGRACTHGYSHYRIYTGAADGVKTPADVISLDNDDNDSPVIALGLRTADELDAFLELFGYWLGDGSMAYCLGSADGVTFSPKKERDRPYLRGLLDRLHLVRGQHFTSSVYEDAFAVRITVPAWFEFFDDEFGVQYKKSRHYNERQALLKQGMHSSQRRPLPSVSTRASRRRPSTTQPLPSLSVYDFPSPPEPADSTEDDTASASSSASPAPAQHRPRAGSAPGPGHGTIIMPSGAERGHHLQVVPLAYRGRPHPAWPVQLVQLAPSVQVERPLEELYGPDDAHHLSSSSSSSSSSTSDPEDDDDDDEEDDPVKSAKWMPHWALHRLDARQLRLVIEGLRQADGSSAATVKQLQATAAGGDQLSGFHQICTSGLGFRDQLVQACLHAGYSAYFKLNTRTGEVRGYNAVPQDGHIYNQQEMEAALQDDSTRQFKEVCANHDNWWVCYTDVVSELLPAEDIRFDGSACRVRQKKPYKAGWVAVHALDGTVVEAASQPALAAQLTASSARRTRTRSARKAARPRTAISEAYKNGCKVGGVWTILTAAEYEEQQSGQAHQQTRVAHIATQAADLYDEERDGRVWCVRVEHSDALIFVQRAHRDADGVVTKVGRAVITGNCLDRLRAETGQRIRNAEPEQAEARSPHRKQRSLLFIPSICVSLSPTCARVWPLLCLPVAVPQGFPLRR